MFLLHESSQLPQGLFKPIKIIWYFEEKRMFSREVTGAILVSLNKGMAACLGWKTCSLVKWLKTLYRIDDSEERWALTPETVQNMYWLTANRKCAQWSLLSVPLLLLRLPFFSKIKKYVISYIIFFLTRLSPVCVFFICLCEVSCSSVISLFSGQGSYWRCGKKWSWKPCRSLL